jgi:pimeloyl-ACP methyl ester carboxylesterase
VMGSGGTYGGGRDEVRDARAAVTRVREEAPDLPTVLCGWSFGASVALREAIDDPRVSALVLIGMPLRPDDLSLPPLPPQSELRSITRPVLVLTGDNDRYCPVEDAEGFTASLPDARLHVVQGTDHYLWRREREAAAVVGAFVDDLLEATGPAQS